MKQVVIFGTGSFAECVHFYLTHDSQYKVAAFTVNANHLKQDRFMGLPVVPFEEVEHIFPTDSFAMFVAVAYGKLNKTRSAVYTEAKKKEYELITYISSKCTHWGDTIIGDNCFIFEDNTIQPFVRIGSNVVMWSGNHIGHHSTIGDHCFIASHVVVSGHVTVGPYCFIGVNAAVREGITIGESCLIGAGTLIMKSTKDKEVYIGQRTRPDSRTSDEINM